MLEYVSLRDYKHLKHLNRVWNGEFHSTYPLKKALYKSKILEDRNLNKDASSHRNTINKLKNENNWCA